MRTNYHFGILNRTVVIWYIYYDCQIRIETLRNIDRNLELIISGDRDILAFRYDHPREMKDLVKDDGKWRFTKEGDELQLHNRLRLELLCRVYIGN